MKKVFYLSLAGMLSAAMTSAQESDMALRKEITSFNKHENEIRKEKREEKKEMRREETNEVSYQTREAFRSDFGNIPGINWTKTDIYDEVTFVKNGEPAKAYYDKGSKLVGTTIQKTFNDLPVKARKYINRKYPGYTKENIFLFDDNELNEADMFLYGIRFDDQDNYFAEMKKGDRSRILKIDMEGNVTLFK